MQPGYGSCPQCEDEDLQTEVDELRRTFAAAQANMEKQEFQANMEQRSKDAESEVSLQKRTHVACPPCCPPTCNG